MSETHIRGISTTLALLDEALCQFEQWAAGREAHAVLYEERNNLSLQQRQAILAEIQEIRPLLKEMRERLNLSPKEEDAASSIWGRCWTLLEPLEELEGRHLRRYGEPPADLVEFVNPRSAEMAHHLRQIAGIASKSHPVS